METARCQHCGFSKDYPVGQIPATCPRCGAGPGMDYLDCGRCGFKGFVKATGGPSSLPEVRRGRGRRSYNPDNTLTTSSAKERNAWNVLARRVRHLLFEACRSGPFPALSSDTFWVITGRVNHAHIRQQPVVDADGLESAVSETGKLRPPSQAGGG